MSAVRSRQHHIFLPISRLGIGKSAAVLTAFPICSGCVGRLATSAAI
jgi:hypothetical protein